MTYLIRRFTLAAASVLTASFSAAQPAAAPMSAALSEVVNIRAHPNYELGRPVANKNAKNEPLRIAGKEFTVGLGTQANTEILLDLNGGTHFSALAGVDDTYTGKDEVSFEIRADGESLWHKVLKAGQPAEPIDLDVKGHHQLALLTEDVGNGYSQAFADWVDAKFAYEGTAPASVVVPSVKEEPVILTPKAPATPRINGARVFGVRPGNPFFYQIAATGERPLTYAAEHLPAGLGVDASTGRIQGVVTKAGAYDVVLRATNTHGVDEKPLHILVGEEIALTPPMGWNSWNCWAEAVDADKVMRSARAMVSSGLIEHGWSYINIDDTWQGARTGPDHALQANEKFPDLKKLADDIHAMGLHVGIYSTPWVTSYAGFAGGSADTADGKWVKPAERRGDRRLGKFSFAEADAKQWAAWGMDYLKYDWNPNEPPETTEMAKALRASGRDIAFSLSNSAPFKNAEILSNLANAWRTTGDIRDTWSSLHRIGFSQDKWRPYSKPGHWNDPDMLVVGFVGWGPKLHPSQLTPNEQYTHISLWSLLSAPLLIGCDLERLDAFTLSLLTNDEVLAVDQDPLGKQATQLVVDGRRQIWVKELADGSHAIGFFNLASDPQTIRVTLTQLGLKGAQQVRDLWRQQDLGTVTDELAYPVARHGVVLVRLTPQAK